MNIDNKIRRLIISVFATALLFSISSCNTEKKELEQQFMKRDKNGDGKVPLAEWLVPIKGAFKKMDTNKNDILSKDEAKPQLIKARDKDKNGELDLQEFISPIVRQFNTFDANKDKSISKEEYVSGFLKKK